MSVHVHSGPRPRPSNFNTEWRKALRSGRLVGRRRRIRALRASTRIDRRANGTSLRRLVRVLVLKVLEVELHFQKILFKIRGV